MSTFSPLPDWPTGCQLRRAGAEDLSAIRSLVFRAALDPTQLRWQQFWLVESQGQVVACGQLREFVGAQELGSLVVMRDWRDRGLGEALSRHLIAIASQPLYLECVGSRLGRFYTRLGFQAVTWRELPPALQRKFALACFAQRLGLPITVMRFVGEVKNPDWL
ncbi:MAG: GNAT family N-acetyltransferase [Spirulinaceae cyanobacterium RM2_2_10]|nr:GNAT family N-acetyltransferase [Spirulinaceae cyanobacterium SM2_1_0]NJO19504.1 GNAT family N-acetyltransferase [Spirulinaceae cyanobacterium RM2_2_10]